MTTKTLTKYDMIQVGDRIVFPNTLSKVKGGIITKVKGLNGHAKEIWTDNDGHFIASRWNPNNYELFRTRKEI